MTVLLAALVIAPPAIAHSTHRTHIVNTDGDTEFQYVRIDGGEEWASFRRAGVRYVTSDPDVLAQIQKAMEKYRELGQEHSRLGRRHSELGREHSALGREHSRLGREHSRLGREASRTGRTSDIDRQQRDVEQEQRKLEEKQRQLEARQGQLEEEQRALEAKREIAEREAHRVIEDVFARAVREGKARRE